MNDGTYKTPNGIEYEVNNGQIMVEHEENGYYGCLYGEKSMSIFKNGKEVLHTGSRSINSVEELYKMLEDMPYMMRSMFGDE